MDAEIGQLPQPPVVLRDRADDAEAIHDIVRDELRVAAADFSVVPVVVPGAMLDIGG